MNIAVIGAGAVGCYFGGRLATAGHNVTFVARGSQLKALKAHGLTVNSINGNFGLKSVTVTEKIKSLKAIELALLCVKAWQVKGVAQELREVISPNTLILPLQNGVLATEEIAEEVGPDRVLAGLCRIICLIQKPGVINHIAVNPTIVLGEVNGMVSERVIMIKDLLEKSGIACEIPSSIQSALWKKYISICVSGLLAVTRSTYGEIMVQPETRWMMREIMMEVYRVGIAAGIPINPDFVDKTMALFDTFPYDSTLSLTRDVLEGRPSEIEYQNGHLVRLGEKHGVETPLNRYVYYSILPMERRARSCKV